LGRRRILQVCLTRLNPETWHQFGLSHGATRHCLCWGQRVRLSHGSPFHSSVVQQPNRALITLTTRVQFSPLLPIICTARGNSGSTLRRSLAAARLRACSPVTRHGRLRDARETKVVAPLINGARMCQGLATGTGPGVVRPRFLCSSGGTEYTVVSETTDASRAGSSPVLSTNSMWRYANSQARKL
jgi:hypothetical protein